LPRVSVIIPTYNNAHFIAATLESVFAQQYHDFEVIVVDDGSTDDTRQVLSPFLDRITYLHQPNSERSAARNNGLSHAGGEYIAFLDSDDLWAPEKLAKQVTVLDANPQISLVFTRARYIDEVGQPVSFSGQTCDGGPGQQVVIMDYSIPLLNGNVVAGGGSAAMVRRWMLEKVGKFDLNLVQSEDWDMWLRLAPLGPFAYIPEPLTSYRVYGWKKLLKWQMNAESIQQHMRIVDKHLTGWKCEPLEKVRLRDTALCTALTLAVLAAYQSDQIPAGQEYLRKAVQIDPALGKRDRLLWLIVDRAKMIETDTGSYDEALAFSHRMLDGLPPELIRQRPPRRQVEGWLFISGAFQQHEKGNSPAVRSLLKRGLVRAPGALSNRGVLSILRRSLLSPLQKVGGENTA
jgi:cellulose synthase/poly-beta-1,6-N-acetylglucosamine synthase-like glycosyltransferase